MSNNKNPANSLWVVNFSGSTKIIDDIGDWVLAQWENVSYSAWVGDKSDEGTSLEYQNKRATIYCNQQETANQLTERMTKIWQIKPMITHLANENWVEKSQQNLPPITVGRYFIYGQHNRAFKRIHQTGLLMEASTAFGTGHHETTYGCLKLLDQNLKSRTYKAILDVGCGSAILGAAAIKITKSPAIGTDIDMQSVQTAQRMLDLNGLRWRMEIYCAYGTKNAVVQKRAPYDLIFANILANPLIEMSRDLISVLDFGGHLILSGFTTEQERKVIGAYRNRGLKPHKKLNINGWMSVLLEKPS